MLTGPGGESIFTDIDGDTLAYRYFDGNSNGNPALGIHCIAFTCDGWP